jgi:hypothetical protein
VVQYPNPANDPNVEIVRVTAVVSDAITITRAQEGTGARSKNTGGKTYSLVLGVTAKMTTDIGAAVLGTSAISEVVSRFGTSFTLAHTPVSGTLRLFGAGQRLTPGAGNDYTAGAKDAPIIGAAIDTAPQNLMDLGRGRAYIRSLLNDDNPSDRKCLTRISAAPGRNTPGPAQTGRG